MHETLPFEVVMALIDIIKAKKRVENWKGPIPKVDQVRQVPPRRLTKCRANLLNGNMQFVILNVFLFFAKLRRTAFNIRP